MSKKWRKVALFAATVMTGTTTVGGLVGCGGKGGVPDAHLKEGTYRTYTSVMPSNWNELTYEDNNDTQILNYIKSPFFDYDYQFDESKGGKYNADGTINAEAIVPDGFTVNYVAATGLEDVTSTVDAKWGYTAAQKQEGGYAYKITLRKDLTWDDGTPIDATDFVYTMREQLSPDFFNMRASTFYNNIVIKNARNYLYSTTAETYETLTSQGYESANAALSAGQTVYFDAWDFWGADGYTDKNGRACPRYVSVTDQTIYDKMDAWTTGVAADPFSGKQIFAAHYGENLGDDELFIKVKNENMNTSFEDVGFYSTGKYELVVCLDNPIQCLKDDGSLSYQAAYSFQGFPLVKRDLYERCKQEPVAGSTLYTTNYNSSKETTASWGPYKLTSFQSGKSYTLERNDKWFAYDLPEYANQYSVSKIDCEKISEVNTQWMGFLSGTLDEIGLDVTHKDDYRNSKYTVFTPGTGTFGINLYANLNVLKNNGRNNGILAIDDFRKAISLFIDRDDYNSTCYTAHKTCFGLLGPSYYYDVENGGIYRDTEYAKKGLLRVYGFTENDDGTWTDGNREYGDYEAAYEAMDGRNPSLAKQLAESAYAELTANAAKYGYNPSRKIELIYGTSDDNENSRRNYNYITNVITELIKGTALEGKIVVTFNSSYGKGWAKAFKSGEYEIAAGTGFSGGAFDPESFLQCYVDPEAGLMYSAWWDTENEELTYTMPEGEYMGAGQEFSMSVYNWYCCLNGIAESRNQPYSYNWGSGAIPETARMQLLARLEEHILKKYYTVMTTSQYSASLLGAKFTFVTDEYNTFMGFGGYRYMRVNYTDGEWSDFVARNNNDLTAEYKKTN